MKMKINLSTILISNTKITPITMQAISSMWMPQPTPDEYIVRRSISRVPVPVSMYRPG